jgi:hypothetical protein
MKKHFFIALFFTLLALGFRLLLVLRYPNDWPGDARTYMLLAKNVMERNIFSSDAEEPYKATYFRVPAYPVFLIGCYRLFGQDNNKAVRIIQAIFDTASCWLVALLALAWSPVSWQIEKRRRAMLIALALAAINPFNAIYVSVLLTEVLTTFAILLSVLLATYALKRDNDSRTIFYWLVTGIFGGLATMLRPDAALFTGGIGVTLALIGLTRAWKNRKKAVKRSLPEQVEADEKMSLASPRRIIGQTILSGLLLSAGFALALAPWTIRNYRVFHVFMPIAPTNATMPGEFAATGYSDWLKTWVDNWYYTETVDWVLDTKPITIEQIPAYAFDSEDEKNRVAELLNRYNNPKPEENNPQATAQSPDADDSTGDDDDSGDDDDDTADNNEPPPAVEMTPEIDAGFEQIARERIARHPFRYYVTTRLKRAYAMWFSSHSGYYPFSGDYAFGIDRSKNQHIWIPLFIAVVWLFTIIGLAGVIIMWRHGDTWRWVLLLFLLTIPRFAYLTTLQNPEPRYVVEYFPLLLAAAGVALAAIHWRRAKMDEKPTQPEAYLPVS